MYRVVCKNYLGECSDVSTLEITQSEFRARGATLPYYERFKKTIKSAKIFKKSSHRSIEASYPEDTESRKMMRPFSRDIDYKRMSKPTSRGSDPRSRSSSRMSEYQASLMRHSSQSSVRTSSSLHHHNRGDLHDPYFIIRPKSEQVLEGDDAVFTARCAARLSHRG